MSSFNWKKSSRRRGCVSPRIMSNASFVKRSLTFEKKRWKSIDSFCLKKMGWNPMKIPHPILNLIVVRDMPNVI